MKVTAVYWSRKVWRRTRDNNEGNTGTRKVWRRTRDNNEGNCRLLALEKYGEERGITMKVTVVYWH